MELKEKEVDIKYHIIQYIKERSKHFENVELLDISINVENHSFCFTVMVNHTYLVVNERGYYLRNDHQASLTYKDTENVKILLNIVEESLIEELREYIWNQCDEFCETLTC